MKKTCILVDIERVEKIFRDEWWNDNEDVYCIPTREAKAQQAEEMDAEPEFDGWRKVDFIIAIGKN